MPTQSVTGLHHPALVYSGLDRFLDHIVPFIADGIERGEPVLAAVGTSELAALRRTLGADRPGMTLVDTREWHPHTGTRLRAFHEFVTDQLAAGMSHVRLVGEPVCPDDSPEMAHEWTRYESALNAVLGPFPVTLACTYPEHRLDPEIVENAARTHPVLSDGTERRSPLFVQPHRFLHARMPAVGRPPALAAHLAAPGDLAEVRRFLTELAQAAGVEADRIMDLVIAANEVLTNAIVHGRGAGGLWAWSDADGFACQVEDDGSGIVDPLAGYRPPKDTSAGGRGLWMARQLVDLLQIVTGPAGTTVRLRVAFPRAA